MLSVADVPSVLESGKEFLTQAGFRVGQVFRVESTGESGYGCEVIVYTTPHGEPREAHITPNDITIYNYW